jgi:hypothetical protein
MKKLNQNNDELNSLMDIEIRKGFLYYCTIIKNIDKEIILEVVEKNVEKFFKIYPKK